MPKESQFQAKLIKQLKEEFPGCKVFKNDPNYIQGVPDLTILYKDKWASLECKKSLQSKHQPNQDIWIEELNSMSYAKFICPENKEEVLDGLRKTFGIERNARIS